MITGKHLETDFTLENYVTAKGDLMQMGKIDIERLLGLADCLTISRVFGSNFQRHRWKNSNKIDSD